MKNIIFLLVGILFGINSFATNYYLASNGNDTDLGTDMLHPWQSIDKLNQMTFVGGDSILFRKGDVFRGEFNLSQGGSQLARLVITSYGSGNKPIISGSVINSNWASVSGYSVTSITDSVAYFYVSGHAAQLARYPNDHQYLKLDSAQTTYLKDQSLTTLNANLLQGNICVHTAQWCWEKSEISSVQGNKINYVTPMRVVAPSNYGYFLYNNINHLDTIGEWFYDDVSKQLYFKGENGTDVNSLLTESSIYKNGIALKSNTSYVTISNLEFQKQYNAGVLIYASTNRHIVIDNCDFSGQYNHGVNDKGRFNEIANSNFREIDGIALFVDGTGFKSTIHHNNFRSIGQFRNSGIGTEINSSAIMCAFIDSCYIHHNFIDSVGYCGITVDGAYNIIERNIIKHVMLLNNDGGALKSYGAQSHHNIYRNNFVSESEGNKEGTNNGSFITPAIYFDFNVNNCTIEDNTVYNHSQKGIFQNSGNNNNIIRGNIMYGTNYALDLNGNPLMPTAITGMHVTKNVFFALNDQAYLIRQVDHTGAFNTGIIDSNYYFQPYNTNRYALRLNGMTPTDYSFSAWQATGFDLNTQSSFVSWATGVNESVLFTNPSDTPLLVDLGQNKYLDLDSNDICGQFTLEAYTSRVLIATNLTCQNNIPEIDPHNLFAIYPNPTSDLLKIKTDNLEFEVSLFDLTGRELQRKLACKMDETISLAAFPSGIYQLVIQSEGQFYTYKIIKN